MAVTGAMLYVVFLRALVVELLQPFCPSRGTYNTVGRLPYLASCIYMCICGGLRPAGTQGHPPLHSCPAFFGGLSGLLWGDVFLPGSAAADTLEIRRSPALWITAAVVGVTFVAILGRGIEFSH